MIYAIIIALSMMLFSCQDKGNRNIETPWGTVTDTIAYNANGLADLSDIKRNGELIMLTLSGPDTYYEFKGRQLGLHFLLCQRFAEHIGVRLRVDVCRDTVEMIERLRADEGDIVAITAPLGPPLRGEKALVFEKKDSVDNIENVDIFENFEIIDSLNWITNSDKTELIAELNSWFSPKLLAETKAEEQRLLSTPMVRRRVFSPMLNRKGGVISHYDALFIKYGQRIRWDWRLLAAQCYQESTFDPEAKSWAGAVGLMQIMPSTATHLGLPHAKLTNPESNIEAATRYIAELEQLFGDIKNRAERQKFVLAAYNGGHYHIRDAMALAAHDGRNTQQWREVSPYVLKLMEPKYYRSPLVKHGYMRGTETVDYVEKIQQRWKGYAGIRSPQAKQNNAAPSKGERKAKYRLGSTE